MAQIEVKGIVPVNFSGDEFSLRVLEAEAIETFYRENCVDTGLRYAEGLPILSVRGDLASKCTPGETILLTLETNERGGKIGIRNISVRSSK
jgi:hypothetical protein